MQRAARQAGHGLEHAAAGHSQIVEFHGIACAREPAGHADDRDGLALIPPTVHCPPAAEMFSWIHQ
jgi:hypothetical protein